MYKLALFMLFVSTAVFAQEDIKYIDFTGISASGEITVTLMKAEGPSGFTLEMVSGNKEDVRIESNGTTLKVLIPNNNKTGRSNAKANVVVYHHALREISAKAGARITGNTIFETDQLDLVSGYNASIVVSCNAAVIAIDASSKSKCTVSGKTDKLIIDAKAASVVNCGELISTNSIVSASSASRVSVNTIHELVANTSSGSTIKYAVKPEIVRTNEDHSGGTVSQM
ncbi:MAG: DUF2807 domain-containing protein [Saprospiraceae bacterium]|nr:DUF2807 domain-containing protein [Saprospiraceae bacterium]